MGGELKWEAVPIVAGIFGMDDIERFVMALVEIREYLARKAKVERG